jgi:hypothetical protein
MHYLEELIHGEGDKEHVHRRFIRYGRGEYPGAVISIKKDRTVLKVAASEDYINSIGEILAKGSKENFSVSGSIISREDVSPQIKAAGLDIKKTAKKKGVYAIQVAGTLSGTALHELYSALESAHMLLELKSGSISLKSKKSLPKPSGGVDEKFCSATMPAEKLQALLKEVCSDPIKEGFDELVIEHTYIIKDLAIPEKYKNDYAAARIQAKRKGVMKRTINAGSQKTTIEHEFSA